MHAEASLMESRKGISRLTRKHQVTIPKGVRERLGLEAGDTVAFEEGLGGEIRLRKVTPLDIEFAVALEDTLSEWHSESDEEAYRDL